jgi:hypothetical protein
MVPSRINKCHFVTPGLSPLMGRKRLILLVISLYQAFLRKAGGPGGTRTRDLSIKSRLLYQLSYGPTLAAEDRFSGAGKGFPKS